MNDVMNARRKKSFFADSRRSKECCFPRNSQCDTNFENVVGKHAVRAHLASTRPKKHIKHCAECAAAAATYIRTFICAPARSVRGVVVRARESAKKQRAKTKLFFLYKFTL